MLNLLTAILDLHVRIFYNTSCSIGPGKQISLEYFTFIRNGSLRLCIGL